MSNGILTGCAALISLLIAFGINVFPKYKENKSIASIKPNQKKEYLLYIGMLITVIAVTCFLVFLYESTWTFGIKRLLICSILWPLAFVDYEKHIIPNYSLAVMLVCRLIILFFEFIFCREAFFKLLLSDAIACIACLLLMVILRVLVKNGIGFGDVKLFSVIGLFVGINGIISVLFLSFLVSFIVSIFLLLTKKKDKKDQLAFAPFILIGTTLAVILFGA